MKLVRSLSFALVLALPLSAADLPSDHAAGIPGAVHALTLPVVGNVMGANGTHYRTDVTIANMRNVRQRVRITWMPQDPASSSPRTIELVLEPMQILVRREFTQTVLERSGLGAVRIMAVDDFGSPATGAEIDAFARVWATSPGAAGTFSQGVAAVYDGQLVRPTSSVPNAFIVGLRHDAEYRTNVGIVNLDATAKTFTVGVNGTGGSTQMTVDVPAMSLRQVPLPAGNWGDLTLNIRQTTGPAGGWTAYGSSNHNVSADGWTGLDVHRQFHAMP